MWPVTTHVYKRATEPGLLAGMICTQLNGRKHKILKFMEIALSNSYQLLIWLKGAHLKTCPAFTFITLVFMWKLWHKISTFTKWPMRYLACQNSQRMYKVTLIVNKGHMVYTSYIFRPRVEFFLVHSPSHVRCYLICCLLPSTHARTHMVIAHDK